MEIMENGFVLNSESCTLTLNYAYYHVLFCLLQASVLAVFGRTKNFRVAHAFGLFALVMDYGLNYLNTGTRTISYPYISENLDSGPDEPLGPLEAFSFFVWFDYSAFGILLWALTMEELFQRSIEDILGNGTKRRGHFHWLDVFSIIILPLQFWSAPILSPYLDIDDRTLILERESSKTAYGAMVCIFPILLHFVGGLSVTFEVLPIALSGFACGLVHHAALFTFGMRGYASPYSLFLTLCTEWPALIMGVAVVRKVVKPVLVRCLPFVWRTDNIPGKHQQSQLEHGTKIFSAAMWVALLTLIYPHVSNLSEKDAVAFLIPLVPGQCMQSVGTAFLRTRTCIMPEYIPKAVLDVITSPMLDCWGGDAENRGEDMLVIASAAKSGAVLSARIVAEIGSACGVCVASGERSSPGIPGPVEDLPVYRGQLLHAIVNMRTWPNYVKHMGYDLDTLVHPRRNDPQELTRQSSKQVRCVVLVRDPLSRLRSLYTYARSGGEHWFRYESGIMRELGNSSLTLQKSLELFWETFGKDYLVQSHEYTMMNIILGCQPVTMESFKVSYNETITDVLRAYGVNSKVFPELVHRLSSADHSQKTDNDLKRDAHYTSNKFSNKFVSEVKERLMLMPAVQEMIAKQRLDLATGMLRG